MESGCGAWHDVRRAPVEKTRVKSHDLFVVVVEHPHPLPILRDLVACSLDVQQKIFFALN